MNKHETIWLQAYYDGELDGRRFQQVQAHLAECQACRQELGQLRSLSALLGEKSPFQTKIRPEQFVAQVGLRLPRSRTVPLWQRAGMVTLHLVPALLFIVLVFMNTAAFINNLLASAALLGIGGEQVSSLLAAPQLDYGLELPFALPDLGLNEISEFVWNSLGSYGFFGIDVTNSMTFPFILGMLAFSWMIAWWLAQDKNNVVIDASYKNRNDI